jgi:putative oxidoreductase
MRRLFSTFAAGAPGAGLLALRAAAGAALIVHMAGAIDFAQPAHAALHLATGALGALLFIGLWTPVAGFLAAFDSTCIAWSLPRDRPFWLLLGLVAFALALLGPGKWSVDARLFGWKRVDFGDSQGRSSSLD